MCGRRAYVAVDLAKHMQVQLCIMYTDRGALLSEASKGVDLGRREDGRDVGRVLEAAAQRDGAE